VLKKARRRRQIPREWSLASRSITGKRSRDYPKLVNGGEMVREHDDLLMSGEPFDGPRKGPDFWVATQERT
jgi:hypothetical protein